MEIYEGFHFNLAKLHYIFLAMGIEYNQICRIVVLFMANNQKMEIT